MVCCWSGSVYLYTTYTTLALSHVIILVQIYLLNKKLDLYWTASSALSHLQFIVVNTIDINLFYYGCLRGMQQTPTWGCGVLTGM